MQHLSEQIMANAEQIPEGAALAAKGLLHLGSRAGVDQALRRLTERRQLMRAGFGIDMRPV